MKKRYYCLTELLPPHKPLWRIVEITNGEVTGFSITYFDKPDYTKLDTLPILCQENAVKFAFSIMPRSVLLGRG